MMEAKLEQIEIERPKVIELPDGRMSRKDAAKFLGFAPSTLADWHRLGKGPRSRMVGGRRFYDVDGLREFAGATAE